MFVDLAMRMVALKADAYGAWKLFALVVVDSESVT